MIRSLRWRLVAVTMALLTVVMGLAIFLFLNSTYRGIENDSLHALHQAGMRYGLHPEHEEPDFPNSKPEGAPDKAPGGKEDKGPEKPDKEQKLPIPCFVAGYDHDGVLYADGTRYYDLTDSTYLAGLVEAAGETGQNHGILAEEGLRFLRLDDICGNAYAFTDITGEQGTMLRLFYQYLLIGLLAMLGFFIISMLTSRWAVRPIERVMAQQRQFIADASHELKTPLTVILTNTELLADRNYSPEEKKTFTGNILTMAQQMRGLVEELLDLARADSGTVPMSTAPLDLSALVTEAALPFEPVYFEAGKSLDICIEPGITVRGNRDACMRMVDILLDNGCKYSLPESTVTLELKRCCRKYCILLVKSQGQALTKQECRDIFKRFYRCDPSRSMNHSYGLGLAIAKTIVTQHKGQLWATSENGINTFRIRLRTVKEK